MTSVIDGQGQKPPPTPARPRLRHVQERHRIAAARERQGDGRARLKVEPTVERRLGVGEIRQAGHLAAAAVAAARAFTAFGATAPYRRSNSPSAEQAWSARLVETRARESFTVASGAQAVFGQSFSARA